MKFLLLSGAGDGLGLAFRLRQEGNDVAVWVRESRAKKDFDGLLKKVKRWEEFLDKDTIVIFDSNGGGKTADRLRSRGHYVFAGSTFADTLEIDRAAAFELMNEAGIKTPHSESFTSWDAAKEYMRSYKERVAFKPSGELGTQVCSYVSYDDVDMIEMLDYYQHISKGKPEFELQDFVKGAAISTEGWFNGERFLTPFNHTLERKQLMNDNLGPSGGCAGNIVWAMERADEVLKDGLLKFAPILQYHEYIGPIDLNTIVNDDGVWALEFTPRFGYDALPSLLELMDEPIGDLIARMAMNKHPREIKLKPGYAAGIRLTIPPYPSEQFRPDEGLPIRGFTKADRDHLYFYNVYFDNDNQLVSSPGYASIVVTTAYSDVMQVAMKRAYALAEKARIPNVQYRTDLTEQFEDDLKRLEPFMIDKGESDEKTSNEADVSTVGVGAPNPSAD